MWRSSRGEAATDRETEGQGGGCSGGGGRAWYMPSMARASQGGPVLDAIAVDAACSGNPGPMEYRGVEIATGEQLFLVGPIFGTNNLGEFLAIVHGLAWLQAQARAAAIYTDSTTALNWVRRGQVRTTLPRTEKSEAVWKLVERAHRWLRHEAPAAPDLRKWPTKQWGEIPADFGRK